MPNESKTLEAKSRRILVAGDVCLDVVGVPVPPQAPSANAQPENWRLTGEMRTHFLPGGAMLLAEFIRAPKLVDSLANEEKKAQEEIKDQQLEGVGAAEHLQRSLEAARRNIENEIMGPRPIKPEAVAGHTEPLYTHEFLAIAERLSREEIVHSLLAAKPYNATAAPKEKRKILRVEHEYGYSGPVNGDPTLQVEYPKEAGRAQIIVLDDTGNRFRKGTTANPWPPAIAQPETVAEERPLVIYKLHRPFPEATGENALWRAVANGHTDNRLVIVSIDDLRNTGAPISLGLSWERTALDVVWHLLNLGGFSELRNCPRLVIRLGMDGAILWQGHADHKECRAWLIYDPESIEGGFVLKVDGRMVSYGSAFTAGLVHELAACSDPVMSALLGGPANPDIELEVEAALQSAIKAGLLASRRVLEVGFGSDLIHPHYPGATVFVARGDDETKFACQPIPIIPGALEPDRGRWRLLNDIFHDKSAYLHRAVALTATGRKPPTKNDDTSPEAEEDRVADTLLKEVPMASFGALRTHDRREIEHYRALRTLLRDYLRAQAPPRPLSVAVFGPPGAGKSFGVKEVAASLKGQPGCKEVEPLTFNLSLYQKPDDLAAAFHLVRDVALKGRVPLVFFDEFDTTLDGNGLGWLRYFLSPMQDGEFLDRGTPHPVGQSIFVFAGGTGASFEEFNKHRGMNDAKFKAVKGPDFLSRLRATLDIPSLNFPTAGVPVARDAEGQQTPDRFDPYGDIDAFPCEAAILLRRAGILNFNLKKKSPTAISADGGLAIDPGVLRALLHLPGFEHGNRSFEALLDMSHLLGATRFTPSLLPAQFQIRLHADAAHFGQLVGTAYPYTHQDRKNIAREIHKHYLEQRKKKGEYDPTKDSHQEWDSNLKDKYKHSNAEQADDIPRKLFALGLWFRKILPASIVVTPENTAPLDLTHDQLEEAAQREHDRWVAAQRSNGWVYDEEEDPVLRTHPCILPWNDSRFADPKRESQREKDRDAIRAIPRYLAAAGYEVIDPSGNHLGQH